MVMTGRSTTTPTKLTVPAAGEVTGAPSYPAPRSTPRCPLSQGFGGGSKLRRTFRRGASGHCHEGAGTAAPAYVEKAPGRAFAVRRTRAPVVHLVEQFAAPSTLPVPVVHPRGAS